MVAGSFFMHTITNVAISTLNLEATPEIIHDRNPTKNERHSRHNKALISLHSARHFCVFYFMALTTMLIFGSAKGDLTNLIPRLHYNSLKAFFPGVQLQGSVIYFGWNTMVKL